MEYFLERVVRIVQIDHGTDRWLRLKIEEKLFCLSSQHTASHSSVHAAIESGMQGKKVQKPCLRQCSLSRRLLPRGDRSVCGCSRAGSQGLWFRGGRTRVSGTRPIRERPLNAGSRRYRRGESLGRSGSTSDCRVRHRTTMNAQCLSSR